MPRTYRVASVYLTGVVEYLLKEVLGSAVEVALRYRRRFITPDYIKLGVWEDGDMSELWDHVIIPQTGFISRYGKDPVPPRSTKPRKPTKLRVPAKKPRTLPKVIGVRSRKILARPTPAAAVAPPRPAVATPSPVLSVISDHSHLDESTDGPTQIIDQPQEALPVPAPAQPAPAPRPSRITDQPTKHVAALPKGMARPSGITDQPTKHVAAPQKEMANSSRILDPPLESPAAAQPADATAMDQRINSFTVSRVPGDSSNWTVAQYMDPIRRADLPNTAAEEQANVNLPGTSRDKPTFADRARKRMAARQQKRDAVAHSPQKSANDNKGLIASTDMGKILLFLARNSVLFFG